MKDDVTLEQTEELYRFLQGQLPDGFHCKKLRLSERQAFRVIWFIQEHLRIIPDHYERCCGCGELYDTLRSGGVRRGRTYCEGCF